MAGGWRSRPVTTLMHSYSYAMRCDASRACVWPRPAHHCECGRAVCVGPLLFSVQYSLSFPHFPRTRSVCSHSCSRVRTPKPLLLPLPPPPPPSLTLNSRGLIYFLLLLTSQLFISLILLPLSPKSRISLTVRLFRNLFLLGERVSRGVTFTTVFLVGFFLFFFKPSATIFHFIS